MIALVIGATGATGKDLVQNLINDTYFSEIKLFVRNPITYKHPKVKVIVVDFEELGAFSDEIYGDVFFSCLGTTLKQAGSKESQWEIDFDIPYTFGKAAKANGVKTCVLVSSYGAHPNSAVFYSRMKGALEEALEALIFDRLIIFRPGSLIRSNSTRIAEQFSVNLLEFLNSCGLLKKFKPLPTHVLAEKLVKAAKEVEESKEIIELQNIFTY